MTFELHNMTPTEGSRKKIKRVGRGIGSGMGKTSTRGENGFYKRHNAMRLGFEGGQNPLYLRLPKRGFNNIFRKEYAVVNLVDLNRFDKEFNPVIAFESGLVKKQLAGIKILGSGKLEKAITVTAHKFSKSALAAIEKAGGKAIILPSKREEAEAKPKAKKAPVKKAAAKPVRTEAKAEVKADKE